MQRMQKLKFKLFQNPGRVVQVPSPTAMADVGNSITLQTHPPQNVLSVFAPS